MGVDEDNRNKIFGSIALVSGVVILIAISALIVGSFLNSESFDCTQIQSISNSQTILADNNSAQTLSPIGLGITSNTVITLNSWIDTDGINDYIKIEDDSYPTISFWYKNNSETAWQHIVNTSGILYWNATEVDSLPLYPVFFNGSDWLFGQTGVASFIKVSIDSIKFYNSTINITEVNNTFNNGRL